MQVLQEDMSHLDWPFVFEVDNLICVESLDLQAFVNKLGTHTGLSFTHHDSNSKGHD